MQVDAIILAGGDGEVVDPACRFKGLVPVAGRPLVEWVVDAFIDAETIADTVVVMPTAENLGSWVDKVERIVVSDRSFMDNVMAGLGALRGERPVLVATGDIPLVTAEAIDDFVRQSLASGADFTYPLVKRSEMEIQYPGSERTYFRLRSGWHTGGNLMLANPALVPAIRDLGQRLFDQRKNPVGIVKTAGLGFALKFVLGRLQPEDLGEKIRQLLGGAGAAIPTTFASLAVDVDKPADLILVQRVLAHKAGAGEPS